MKQGYIRVGAVVPSLSVGNITDNVKEIKKMIKILEKKKVSIITFPELSLTGYTCQDMFFNATLLDEVKSALSDLCKFSKSCNSVIVVGAVLNCQSKLYNCAVVIYGGEILGVVPKTYLANYNEFYEQRWFTSALELSENQILINGKYYPFGTDILFRISDEICFGVEICEDLWAVKPPSDDLALAGANIILNLSASNETIGKYEFRKNLVSMQSAKTLCAYVYASSGVNESTTDLLYSGQALIVENGSVLSENERFDFESNFIYADIDYEFLNQERFVNKTFAVCSDKNVNRKFR
ncbi:MAG: nitrilase-related carbon-nitrogen hydrolase, partial [Christensenellales bacterium]